MTEWGVGRGDALLQNAQGFGAEFVARYAQADKLEPASQAMLARHRENDMLPVEPDLAEKLSRRYWEG